MKKHTLTLTERQWFQIIEGLDETGLAQAKTVPVRGNGKHRKNGRKLLALAEVLRNKLYK